MTTKTQGTKLTPYARKSLEKALINQAYNKIRERFSKEKDVLAKEALKEGFGEDVFEQFAAIPEGWLPYGNQFMVVNKSDHHEKGIWLYLEQTIRMPHKIIRSELKVSTELYSKVALIEEQEKEAKDEAVKLAGEYVHRSGQQKGQIHYALAIIQTVEELKEKWPEAYALLPAEFQANNHQLPALPLSDAIKTFQRLMESVLK